MEYIHTHIVYTFMRSMYPQFRTTGIRPRKVKFCCAVWHGIVIIIFTVDCYRFGTAVTIAVWLCVCLQSVWAGPLGSNWDVTEAKWHHATRTYVSASEIVRGLWKSARRGWATVRLNEVTRSVLSLSSDLYCQIRGECVYYFSSPSVTK
jgi:hypothetical protein